MLPRTNLAWACESEEGKMLMSSRTSTLALLGQIYVCVLSLLRGLDRSQGDDGHRKFWGNVCVFLNSQYISGSVQPRDCPPLPPPPHTTPINTVLRFGTWWPSLQCSQEKHCEAENRLLGINTTYWNKYKTLGCKCRSVLLDSDLRVDSPDLGEDNMGSVLTQWQCESECECLSASTCAVWLPFDQSMLKSAFWPNSLA